MDNYKNGENVLNDFFFIIFFIFCEDIQIIFLFFDMYLLFVNKKKIEDIGNLLIKLNFFFLVYKKKKEKCKQYDF